MRADEFAAEPGDAGGEARFHRGLRGPAFFVGGGAEVATGDEEDGFGVGFFEWIWRVLFSWVWCGDQGWVGQD